MTIAVRDLGVTLGGTQALQGVTASIERGGMTAICGPNGAGKSTLLSALAGLVTPAAGEVLLAGRPLSSLPAKARARRIGYLPQDGTIAWDIAVRGVVALGRLPHGDAASAPVEQALAALDLRHLAARPVSTLSGGEKARVLLARVLAGEPEWILADEPLAALDLAHQLAILRRLRAAADNGAGAVLVLHDLALAMNHADRVLVLEAGRLVADGAPQEALSAANIARIWGVEAGWLGEPGARALAVR